VAYSKSRIGILTLQALSHARAYQAALVAILRRNEDAAADGNTIRQLFLPGAAARTPDCVTETPTNTRLKMDVAKAATKGNINNSQMTAATEH
jgi:hypothetical protein